MKIPTTCGTILPFQSNVKLYTVVTARLRDQKRSGETCGVGESHSFTCGSYPRTEIDSFPYAAVIVNGEESLLLAFADWEARWTQSAND